MRARILSALKVQPGEAPLIGLLVGMMLLATAGSAAGGASIDALFFARFGVDSLPLWYIVLGLANFLNLILVAGLAGKVARARLYRFLPLVLVAVLALGRGLLALNLHWFYPALYVGKEVINSLQGVFLWGLAGSLLDARQAKRLFPLFTAGGIAGTMLGSFSTPLLVNGFGAENMLLAWGLALAGAGLLCWALVRRNAARLATQPAQPGQPAGSKNREGISALFDEVRQGYRYVRGSSLLGWFSLATLLFSVLWFSLLLPFSRLSTQQFPDANALAGFFGLFQGLWTVAALLVSLFLAGRLFARFGLILMLAVYPLIYLVAFGVLAAFAVFPLIAAFRFVQLIWGQSVAETAWQATFNAVPPARRDQARAFMAAVPGQAGVVLSGLILLGGEQAFQPQQLYLIGLAAAAVCTWAVWRARKAYSSALTEALRTGQPQVFYAEEEPFGGFQRDPAAQDVLLSELASPDAGMRRLSAEILGRFPGQRAARALLDGLADPDPEVRTACLASLAEAQGGAPGETSPVLSGVAACLADPHPDVRRQAVKTLQRRGIGEPEMLALQPLLADADPAVRAQTASALLQSGQTRPALSVLEDLSSSPDPPARAHALRSLGDCTACVDLSQVKRFLADGLRDPSVAVRLAALEGLAEPPAELGELLVHALGDEDPAVCRGAAAALGRLGQPALPQVLDALEDGCLEDGALLALEGLPTGPAEGRLQAYVARKVACATTSHAHARFTPRPDDAPAAMLAESLRKDALAQAFRALRAFALLHERGSIATAIQGLQSRDPLQAAYALEALEAAGETSLIRPLLRLWETGGDEADAPDAPLMALLDDPDAWLRACAALAARSAGGNLSPPTAERLARLAQSDPDEFVRAAAAAALPGGDAMQTLSTLSLMERILFLRRVPLFADLAPVDLKQVAAIGFERLYPDGATITCQGDPGNELYIIVSGLVRVTTGDGKLIVLRKPGEYVGEMAIISQAPRMFSLVAEGDTRLLCVGQKEFEAILRQRPEVSLAVMRVLCDRLREQSN